MLILMSLLMQNHCHDVNSVRITNAAVRRVALLLQVCTWILVDAYTWGGVGCCIIVTPAVALPTVLWLVV